MAADWLKHLTHVASFVEDDSALKAAQLILDHIFSDHGLILNIVYNKVLFLISRFQHFFLRLLETKETLSFPYRPGIYVTTETLSRKLEELIDLYADFYKLNWNTYLTEFAVAYKFSVQTLISFTPNYFSYGQHPRIVPQDALGFKNHAAENFFS